VAALAKALSLDLPRIFGIKSNQPTPPLGRLELEARAAHAARQLDDRMLTALIEIAGALKRAQIGTDPGDKLTGGGRTRR
jgi:hypothetical protein